MKLNYNIIWVDDKIDTRPYLSMKKDLADFINNEFFDCTIQEAEDFNEFKKLFTDNFTYDLIITDLSLNNGTTGKEVIDFVRENRHNHTEIFFYSANTQLRQQELINSNRITFYQLTEGRYNELKDEIIDLVKLTISKFQNIVTMRGMIMHETSALDISLSDIATKVIKSDLQNFIEKNPKIDLKKISDGFMHSIKKNVEEKHKKIFSTTLKDILKDDIIFNAGEKINVIGLFIDELNDKGHGLQKFTDDYKLSINKVRNNFAHAVLEIDPQTGRQFFKKGDFTFDEESCKGIRKNILTHKGNIENLQSLIK